MTERRMDMRRATRAAGAVAAVTAAAWAAVMLGAPGAEGDELRVERPSVIDGDTFRTEDGETIRLWGIDAPEIDTPPGADARIALNSLLSFMPPITCWRIETGPYGRTIARCEDRSGHDIACGMVRAGHARDWPRYSRGYYADCAS